jgi:hypothetical protein
MSGKIKKSNLDADVTAMINTLITEGSSDVSTTDDVAEGSTNLYYTDARADARITAADTDDLSEGSTNLYYTDARADARITAASTDDLSEGSTNLYYTDARANARADAQIAAADTDDLSEGSTNLYYTDARADARITAADTDDLSEGSTNLYFTDARADARITAADTDDLSEGSTNLYYTDARADARIAAADTDDLSEGSTNLYYTDARVDTRLSGNRTFGNITTTGYLAGPATFTIDPAAVGDDTGTVVIAGSLQVDGTTTTINSATMTVDDLNITLASGAVNASAANGAGITVDGASATIIYDGTNDEWDFNKNIHVAGNVIVSGTVDGRNVASDGTKLDGIAASANNYVHPTHPGDDAAIDTGALTGATVISDLDLNITTDTLGHVTDANATVATRTLTLANLGYTGATNANYITNNNELTNGAGYTTYTANQAVNTSSNVTFGTVTATPAATLIVYNSGGTAVKTINGITAA